VWRIDNAHMPNAKKAPRHDFVYLASQSPRRRQLLDQIGVRHELLLPDASEDIEALEVPRPGEHPRDYVGRVALDKLAAAQARLQRSGGVAAPILCADTTVAIGRRIYGKPADASEAKRMLAELSGRRHRVLTAVAVAGAVGGQRGRRLLISESIVSVVTLPPAAIAAYVASGDPFGKAGAYAVQGPFAAWIDHLAGSYSGVMGLPLYETASLLRRAGVRLGPP
jgi:septum formation protein